MSIELDKHIGQRNDGLDSSRDNPDNYITCAECKQSIFMGDLGEVFHHEDPGHKPIRHD